MAITRSTHRGTSSLLDVVVLDLGFRIAASK